MEMLTFVECVNTTAVRRSLRERIRCHTMAKVKTIEMLLPIEVFELKALETGIAFPVLGGLRDVASG